MTKRELGIFLIGIGLGLLLSLAVILEVMLSLREGSSLSSYGFDRVAFILPALLLLTGTILLATARRSERNSN